MVVVMISSIGWSMRSLWVASARQRRGRSQLLSACPPRPQEPSAVFVFENHDGFDDPAEPGTRAGEGFITSAAT